ncbi:hypothetical protein PTSG_13184 [Salpingoeca rosetta]|uniref:Gcp-like domain-containing protein n=1 Tax=Salpingoeca rosetta (strain ATCC 50818 / BSB-021) TaxID=946362 RepID=F2UTA1_SALR5|nr:uncharacterized protein PTSG_13184 [Salpingoeca rosetta]EGD81857.1 hypothetical protein PTSG_13184 [Salpingoeca rosetta]|eukprot:XP_004987605.1 hypothetical protein PTSG_13184 [Salpingoeca rosetta]
MAMRGGWRVAARRWREVTAATGVARQNRVPHREYSKQARPLVLGIESTFDDTGVCILDSTGHVLGESLLSQREHHVK